MNFLTADVIIEVDGARIRAQLTSIRTRFTSTVNSIIARSRGMRTAVIRSFRRMATAAVTSFKKIAKVAKWATVAILAVGLATIKMAMDAEESENLFEVSMGKMAKATRKWSKELSEALFLNEFELRKNVATFNVMFKSMGFNADAAVEMSKGLTMMAEDMASFYNLKPVEAFDKLRAAITGEAEGLKRLGILVNESTIKQFALNNAIGDGTGKLTELEKVQARYGAILAQTVAAQGDLQRTLESGTNVYRSIWTLVKQLAVEFGSKLLPAVTDVGLVFRNWLVNNKTQILEWADSAIESVTRVKNSFMSWVTLLKTDWRTGLKTAFKYAQIEADSLIKIMRVTFFHGGRLVAKAFIRTFGTEFGKWLVELGDPGEGILSKLSLLVPAISEMRKAIMRTGIAMAKDARDISNDLASSAGAFKSAINDVLAGRRAQIDALSGLTSDAPTASIFGTEADRRAMDLETQKRTAQILARDEAERRAGAPGEIPQTGFQKFAEGFNVAAKKIRDDIVTIRKMGVELANSLQNNMSNAFTSILDGTKSWKEGMKGMIRSIAAEMLSLIVRMQVAKALFGAEEGGGIMGALFGKSISVETKYGGGKVGRGPKARNISPLAFAGAPRFKNGGIAGLRTGEIPAILHKGEEVIKAGESKQPIILQSTINNYASDQVDVKQRRISPTEVVTDIVVRDAIRGGPISQALTSIQK